MKCMIVLILAVAVAIQASPYYGPMMGGYDSGSSYGNSRYGNNRHGYNDQGYGSNLLNEGHDIRHEQNDFDASVHRRHSSDHNIGHFLQGNNYGHNNEDFGSSNQGHNGYGNRWMHGGY